MADSVASTQSRPQRVASKKRRQATVPTETENKLARAARSAQRLAQLSDASRDDSTLDLFPDDPTRATLEAMNIDIRQGTLHGFELPDVVLAAVGAIDGGDNALVDARAARRAPRAAKPDDQPVPVNALLSGLEIEPLVVAASPAGELALGDAKTAADTAASAEENSTTPARDASTPLTPAMAAATVARSVTALRQAAEPDAKDDVMAASTAGGVRATQRLAATFGKAASASGAASASASVSQEQAAVAANVTGTTDEPGSAQPDAAAEGLKPGAVSNQHRAPTEAAIAAPNSTASETSMDSSASAQANAAFATPWREARRAEAAAAALRAAPELDRARATAFADTVDALYGVIADQRHAATDHSRRMKWMLSIVVGALLVTVAIGITQTVLLMRLTRETSAQQQRIEQMMQNQQAAMASLLDTHLAMATAAATNAASDVAAAALTAPQQAAATPTHARRATRAQHGHKQKAVSPH
ncbi:hypothetical protein B0G81_0417 [Paraburkholderia sp. BL6665CI2N2]|uniref:hypothetical protein n=1 Tax=Paraburkholderia sp. BL6665CI2N2 TaxID=1938806 RepID=UPI0010655D5E|nr:hypothetical protein [Paraburkholderia sp. BL6665CI2N2]TDY20264.1 hypothetical protein B0G81_0417 [Paraburkholderia sp. BL6665CI2N2]